MDRGNDAVEFQLIAMAGMGEAAELLGLLIAGVWLAATFIAGVVAVAYRSRNWIGASLLMLLLFSVLSAPWNGFLALSAAELADPDMQYWHGVGRVVGWLWLVLCVLELAGVVFVCRHPPAG
jgi:hypothetical protein